MSEIIKDEFQNDVDRILNMTDKQAAEVLEKVKVWVNFGRRNGKTLLSLAYNKAIEKAITALRKDVLYVCDQTRCENCSAKDGQCFMTSDINHAANFIVAGDGIYVEKTPAIAPDISEFLVETGTADNSYLNDRMCEKCEEKETCEDYKRGIEHGLIPFGCSKSTESEEEE